MFVIEIFLPLAEGDGQPFPAHLYQTERATLIDRFGGLTAYNRSPATGFWERDQETIRDDIVIFEVMAETLDDNWWRQYRSHLEQTFQQNTVVIRAVAATLL
jgi:hypothetical protein